MSGSKFRIFQVSRLDLRVEAGGWPEAERHRAEIDAAFARMCAANPHLWNGRVILLRGYSVQDGMLVGTCFETDFAAFTWWRARGLDDLSARNFFGMVALEGGDGAFVMGEMGDHTASAGDVYFAGGTPDPRDVTDGVLDLRGSALRELTEEVGLDAGEGAEEEGWDVVEHGIFFALFRRVRFAEKAQDLAARITRFLASETQPELKAVRVIAGENDLGLPVVPYAAAYARWRFAGAV
ncbi:NUDIX hydrolase [Aquabacter cavernae]|uniref:NUDIX hydrolase n=1 Tax=Aquabacter cavernae TaxID=2496029 RepID=UPI000F8F361A|nr:NUDIX hydrolase [Aquabacter cavernae]